MYIHTYLRHALACEMCEGGGVELGVMCGRYGDGTALCTYTRVCACRRACAFFPIVHRPRKHGQAPDFLFRPFFM